MGPRRRTGIALMVAGAAVAAGGVAGLIVGRTSSPMTTTSGIPSATASAAAQPTATATPATLETPQQFLDLLAQAMRSGDVGFMLSRLHPVVIARFGEDACRSKLSRLTDPSASFTVQHVEPPAPYVYTTDTRSTTVPGTYAVTVLHTQQGATSQAVVHITPVGALFRWFTDCAAP